MTPVHVLHISCDYPDTVRVEKTRAVANLISKSNGLRHTVLSLNRSSRPFYWEKTDNLFSINYCAPPLGIFMHQGLKRICDRLCALVDFDFDIIHAHKFSIEGVIGAHMSRKFGKPLLITVRGHTDLTILRAKPHYRRQYQDVAGTASHFFFLAPWTCKPFQKLLGRPLPSTSFLPNITQSHPRSEPRISDRFVTTVNYKAKNHRAKNIEALLRGFRKLLQIPGYDRYGLDIYTTPSLVPNRIRSLADSPLPAGKVRFKPITSNENFIRNLADYIAFVRPSYPETFGMVYIESLLAGIPALHSRKTAIDGYFDDYDFIKKVPPGSTGSICKAMVELVDNQLKYKQTLSRHIEHGTFYLFSQKSIIQSYKKIIEKTLSKKNISLKNNFAA